MGETRRIKMFLQKDGRKLNHVASLRTSKRAARQIPLLPSPLIDIAFVSKFLILSNFFDIRQYHFSI